MLEGHKNHRQETEQRHTEKISLSGAVIQIEKIMGLPKDTSPKNVMHGEVAVQEKIDVSVRINDKRYIATLYRSDYNDNAPDNYLINLKNDMVTLKDNEGITYTLSREDGLALMREIEKTHKNLA